MSSSDSDSDIDPSEQQGDDLDGGMGGENPITYTEFNSRIDVKDDSWVVDYEDVEFGKELGRGSFGRVYKGQYLGTEVAIKQVFKTSDLDVLRVIGREINMIMSCRHPNIVQFMGCIKHNSGLYIITSFLKNSNLRRLLKRTKVQLSWRLRVRMAMDIARAMLYLHRKGIIHRDLKTKNLLCDDKWNILLCDFGLARTFEQGNAPAAMTICGSDFYLSPELILAAEYDEKTDVFSFGIVLVELYSRRKPTSDVVTRSPPSYGIRGDQLAKLAPPDCPKELIDLAIDCTALDPEDRPSFKTILKKLSKIAKDQDPNAPLEPVVPQKNPSSGPAPREKRGFLSRGVVTSLQSKDNSPNTTSTSTKPAFNPNVKTGETPQLAPKTSTAKRDEDLFFTSSKTGPNTFSPTPPHQNPAKVPSKKKKKKLLKTQYSAAIVQVDPSLGYHFFTALSTEDAPQLADSSTSASANPNNKGVLSFLRRKR